jgi:hypothetical protein
MNKKKARVAKSRNARKVRKAGKAKAEWNRYIPADIRCALLVEAGGKCANPGCSEKCTLEFHHIDEWHVYHTHDNKEMIVLCPTCHAQAHSGALRIPETTIRLWKLTTRKPADRGHLYVEPGTGCYFRLGSIDFANGPSNSGAGTVFQLSPQNKLALRVLDGDIMLVGLLISDVTGRVLVNIVENNFRVECQPPITFERRTGKLRITVPSDGTVVPTWVVQKYRESKESEELLESGSIWMSERGAFIHLMGDSGRSGDSKDAVKRTVIQNTGPAEFSAFAVLLNNYHYY